MATRFTLVALGVALSDQVANAIEAEIRASKLVSGDKLQTEALLIKHFAVSRTVIREPTLRLKSVGLIQTRQGSGVSAMATGFLPLKFDTG